jgi:hypothetical protein
VVLTKSSRVRVTESTPLKEEEMEAGPSGVAMESGTQLATDAGQWLLKMTLPSGGMELNRRALYRFPAKKSRCGRSVRRQVTVVRVWGCRGSPVGCSSRRCCADKRVCSIST